MPDITIPEMIGRFTKFLRGGNALKRSHIIGPITEECFRAGGQDYLNAIVDVFGGIGVGERASPELARAAGIAASRASFVGNARPPFAIYISPYHERGQWPPSHAAYDSYPSSIMAILRDMRDILFGVRHPNCIISDCELWPLSGMSPHDESAARIRHKIFSDSCRIVFRDVSFIRFEYLAPSKPWYHRSDFPNENVQCRTLYRLWDMDIARAEWGQVDKYPGMEGVRDAFVAIGAGHHWDGGFRYEWDYGPQRSYTAGRWLNHGVDFSLLRHVIPHPNHSRGPIAMEHTAAYLWGAWERSWDTFPESMKFIKKEVNETALPNNNTARPV